MIIKTQAIENIVEEVSKLLDDEIFNKSLFSEGNPNTENTTCKKFVSQDLMEGLNTLMDTIQQNVRPIMS